MRRTVLFAGGPLHGTTMTVEDHGRTVMAIEPREVSLAALLDPLDPYDPMFRQVTYSLSRFVMCGRIIWIGHLGAEPDDDLVFEVLASDGAKAASNVYEPSGHP